MIGGQFDAEMIAHAEDATRIDEALGGKSVIMTAGALAMIGRRAPAAFWKTRAKLARGVADRQKRLEQAHAVAPILPMSIGAEFKSEAAAKAFLSANVRALEEGLERLGDHEQHQISIELPFQAVLERIRVSERWAEIEAAGKKARSAAEKRDFGAMLAEEASALGQGLGEISLRMLGDAALDFERLPVAEDTMVLNAVFLTEREGAGALEGVLEAIDAEWAGALKIRMIGPGPASSFGSVVVEQADLTSAAAELGVAPTATRDEVDAAYRKLMRTTHPDRAGESASAKAAALSEATRLMRRSAAAREQMIEAGLSSGDGFALARLHRDGGMQAGG